MSSVTGSVRRDRDSESLTLSERGGKWESDQEREREKDTNSPTFPALVDDRSV